MNVINVNELFNQLVCLFIIPVSTGRTGASARSVRGDLLRGMLIDHCINTHDTMRHTCATCGKDFMTNDEKVTHCSEKHTGKCWICDKDFVLVEQLQVHLRDEHKMKDATSPEKTKELEEEHRRELERRRRWERQQRAAAKRKRDEEDDEDEDDDQGDRSGKRKKDDDPDYRPSKKRSRG